MKESLEIKSGLVEEKERVYEILVKIGVENGTTIYRSQKIHSIKGINEIRREYPDAIVMEV